jgi:hypothetical protein
MLLMVAGETLGANSKETKPANTKATSVKQKKEPTRQTMPIKQEQQPPPPSPAESAAGEQINWLTVSKGGSRGSSTNYDLGVSVGQNAAGYGTSTNYVLNLGIMQNFSSCCRNRGNVDHLISPIGPIDVADLTFLIDYLFRGGDPPPCEDEGNVDGIISPIGPIDVADLTFLVDYLFRGGTPPPPCM